MTLRGIVAALLVATTLGCGAAPRRGRTVLFASGADLQSINPLLTVHPLARQVQRYVLLMTLARYDSALVPQPYLARGWEWSADRRALTIHLRSGVRWHDGRPTTARDVAWTLNAARAPATGYPRLTDLAALNAVEVRNDSTVTLRFAAPLAAFPDVLTDLAMLPAHLLDTVPVAGLRRAAWNEQPVGNGPFRFVLHESNRRWVFSANPDFPVDLGGPPVLQRLIIVVVDEPTTKLASLAAGEIDFAGINPAHAAFVRKRSDLAVVDYPLPMTYGIVFNTRRPPFDAAALRHAVSLAIDRQEIVDGYLYGFGTRADVPESSDSARALLEGRRVAFELLTVGSGEAALEQMIQARLSAVGFDVRIRQLELSAYLDRVYGERHDFDAAMLGIPTDLAQGHVAILERITGHRLDDGEPVAFIYRARGVQGANRRVSGVQMDLRGELATVARWDVTP